MIDEKMLAVRMSGEEYKELVKMIIKMSMQENKLLNMSEGIRIMIRTYIEANKGKKNEADSN